MDVAFAASKSNLDDFQDQIGDILAKQTHGCFENLQEMLIQI
jgi:hypothetical protein